jgi:hypothetical protein
MLELLKCVVFGGLGRQRDDKLHKNCKQLIRKIRELKGNLQSSTLID